MRVWHSFIIVYQWQFWYTSTKRPKMILFFMFTSHTYLDLSISIFFKLHVVNIYTIS